LIRPRLLLRSLFWLLSGDALAKLATLATTLVAVRVLNPLGFGLYIGLYATSVLAASSWDLGISSLLTRELASGRLGASVVLRLVVLRARTFPMWAIAFAVGALVFTRSIDVPIPALLAFAGASIAVASNAVPLAMLRGNLRFKAAAASLTAGRWCTVVVSLLALPSIGFGGGLTTLAAAVFAGELTILITAAALVARAASGSRKPGYATNDRLTVRNALPFATNSLLSIAYNRFDVLILAALASAGQVSLYAPATRLQDALYLFSGAAAAVALPLTARVWESADGPDEVRRLLRRLAVLGLAVALPLATIIFAYAEPIIRLALGNQYVGAATTTRILIWFLPFAAVTAPLLAGLSGCGRAVDATKVFGMAFAVALIMHLSLDWWLGATGAAVASLARDPAAFVVAMVYARRAGIVGAAVPSHGREHTTASEML
jgi:O-antigen/teichoic acid export membrane protein